MTPLEKCVLHASSHTATDAYGAILLAAVLDGLDNVVVAGATTQVARQAVADLRLGGPRGALQHLMGNHDHAGGAEPTLQAMLFPEPFLDGVKLVALGHGLQW